MLPAQFRMRHGDEFARVISSGARSSTRRVVVHFFTGSTRADARVGFVVSKAVGGAVQRNLVKRRLRAAMAEELGELSAGSAVVVRALPAAAGSSFTELREDLHRSWRRAREKDLRRSGATAAARIERDPVR